MRKGIAKLVRKYRRLLPIIGAGIVLLTFVVKDTWKDKVGAIADTVEQAERNHLIREDNEFLMSVIRDIYQRVRYPNDQAQDVDLIASENPYQVYLVVFRLQQQIESRAQLILDLVDHLPGQNKNKTILDGFRKQLDAVQEDLLKVENSMPVSPASPGADRQIPTEFLPLLKEVRKDTSVLWHEVLKLDAVVLKQAKGTKESMEYWYGIWNIVSIILFAVGWTLGLVGQIYGVQTGQGGG